VPSGAAIAFINKQQIQNLLIPCLGDIWRHDYNAQAKIGLERRNLAKSIRKKALNMINHFIIETIAVGDAS